MNVPIVDISKNPYKPDFISVEEFADGEVVEIEWEIGVWYDHTLVQGESEDGRKWTGRAELLEDEIIDVWDVDLL